MILLYYIKTQQAAFPAPPPTQEVELCVLFLFFKG